MSVLIVQFVINQINEHYYYYYYYYHYYYYYYYYYYYSTFSVHSAIATTYAHVWGVISQHRITTL